MNWHWFKTRVRQYARPKSAWVDACTVAENVWYRLRDYKGSTMCVLCGWKGYRFRTLSFGGWRKRNELCPSCHSYRRHRLLAEFLRQSRLDTRAGVILDIGAGGSLKFVFNRRDQIYVKADLASALDTSLRLDIQHLPLRDRSVALVICLHVLDHVVDDFMGAKEIERVLQPGGSCILQGRVDLSRELTHDCYPNHSKNHPLQFRDYGRDFPERFGLSRVRFENAVQADADGLSSEKEMYYVGSASS